MSVEELQAHIAKISADIELQKAVLKNLELSKIFVQRQLNSVRDPVARLPLEISSEIFIQCLPPLPFPPGAHRIPMLLLNICSAWTDIALSNPALWATIFISSSYTEDFQQLLKIWLQRSRKHPSSVRLSTSDFKEGAAPITRLYGQQLKHLEICYEYDNDEDGYIDVLGCASAEPLPLLETLTIHSSSEAKPDYGGPQLLQLLRLAPNLAECTFGCDTRPMYNIVNDIQAPLVLPNLRRMIFGDDVDDPTSGDGILPHLTLPRLETLSLSMYHFHGSDLLSFLNRSSPPLRELVLGGGCGSGDVLFLDECLRLVPTLTRFELWWPVGSTFEQFFAPWAESPSSLLPNLRSLAIKFHWGFTIPDSSWEALLRALAARRTKIRTIRIDLCSISSKPAPHILAAFEELVTDGMEVYIGTKIQNFCAV